MEPDARIERFRRLCVTRLMLWRRLRRLHKALLLLQLDSAAKGGFCEVGGFH
ncbi:hypothetical protein BXY66_0378 [Shimia isoporae]|uniref:Uncharacterized protein n=1 Tax=Shimia isoporae TaxID=647720 RepID=A0A4R1NKZ2_9RHOB|nr:hypothetical protein BXY66_0378 [Shimia isoporae]